MRAKTTLIGPDEYLGELRLIENWAEPDELGGAGTS